MQSLKTKLPYKPVLGALIAGVVVLSSVPPVSAATPTLVWSKTLSGIRIVESSPMPINYDGGNEEIIVGARDGKVYILNGADGNHKPNWPQQTANGIDSTASSGDVTGNGDIDIFIGSGVTDQGQCSGGGLYRFKEDGSTVFNFTAIDDAGQSNVQCADPAIHSSPALADFNKDGAADAAVGAIGLKFWNVRQDGAVNNGWPYYWDDTQFASPAVADVNEDGNTDIIAAGDSSPGAPINHRGGMVRAFNANGQQIWEYLTNEIVRSSPSVGDIDGDGHVEVVFGTGNYWVNNGGASDATKVFALNGQTGALKWSKDLGGQTLASPTLADFSGDGRLDVGIGTWEGSNPGRIFLMDGVSGSNLPNYPRNSTGGIIIGQLTTADLDNDGAQDPITTTGGGVYAYSSASGSQLWGIQQGVAGFQNSVLVNDIDGDSRVDLTIAGSKPNGDGVIHRYEFGAGDPANLGSNGWHMFRRNARLTGSWTSSSLLDPPSGTSGQGYRLFNSSGIPYNFGSSPYKGSLQGTSLTKPIVGGASVAGGNGFWQVASDGGIFTFGDADYHGSTGHITLNKPIVGMASTPSGDGYYMVAKDGGIFTFGDAVYYGSTGAMTLNKPIVGMAVTASGNGYYLVASDGGIFTFGDAVYRNSMGGTPLNKPVVGMSMSQSGNGYYMVASDGGIFTFGDAVYRGSTGALTLVKPIVGMMRAPGNNYWLVASDGGLFSFGAPFYGSAAGTSGAPIVGGSVQSQN